MLKNYTSIIANLHELSQSEDLYLSVISLFDNSEKTLFSRNENEEIINKILNLVFKAAIINSDELGASLRKKGNAREVRIPRDSLAEIDDLGKHIGGDVKTVVLRGTSLDDKIGGVRTSDDKEKVIVQATRDYEKWCSENGIQPNQSKVHTFADTMQQARILTIPAKDVDEVYRMASLTYFAHLYDDMIDSDNNLPNQFTQAPRSFGELKKRSSGNLRKILAKSLSLGRNGKERRSILTTFLDIVDGALIQQAGDYGQQKKYSESFKHQVLTSIRNPNLRADLEKMHPMQLALISHVDLDGWFGLEKGNGNGDLAKLWNLWAAPALYCHDREEEIEKEGFRLRYGRELDGSHNGLVDDPYLIQMIDTAEKYLVNAQDLRKVEHLKELGAAYQAFKNTIPEKVRARYEQSLKRLKQSAK